MQDNQSDADEDDFSPEAAAAEVKDYLMATRSLLEGAPQSTPPHKEPGFAGIRGLVSLNRELAKGRDGHPYSSFQSLYNYLEGRTGSSMQHKIKGREFDRVLVVMDHGN